MKERVKIRQKAVKTGSRDLKGTLVGGPRPSLAAKASLFVGKKWTYDDEIWLQKDKEIDDRRLSMLD